MRCPVCGKEYEHRSEQCTTTGIPVPASLTAVLGVRRLSPREVLRLGLQVCDHWRRAGVSLADIRPHQLHLDYDGMVVFNAPPTGMREPEHVGLQALGGLLARALDRTVPDSTNVAPFLEELAGTGPDGSLALARAEIHQRLAGATDQDPLEAHTWADELSEAEPTVGMAAVTIPADGSAPTHVPSGGPPAVSDRPETDPYADTYIRPRSELFPDLPTDPTLDASEIPVMNQDSMPSILADIPGPAAEPMPTEIRLARPEIPASPATGAKAFFAIALVVFLAAVGTAVTLLVW